MAWTIYATLHKPFQNIEHARSAAPELADYGYCWASHKNACAYVEYLYNRNMLDGTAKVFIVKVPDND